MCKFTAWLQWPRPRLDNNDYYFTGGFRMGSCRIKGLLETNTTKVFQYIVHCVDYFFLVSYFYACTCLMNDTLKKEL